MLNHPVERDRRGQPKRDSHVHSVIEESHMIVITTPTGLIGAQVLSNVLGSGEPVRVIARDPSRLPAQARERVEVVPGSHGDIGVVDRAFAGADAVFWLVPRTRTRTAPRPRTWTSPGQRVTPSSVTRSGGWSGSRPWAAARPRRPCRAGDGVTGDGRPDREHWRELPGADDALVHGQFAPPGTGDQEPGHVLHADLRRPQARPALPATSPPPPPGCC